MRKATIWPKIITIVIIIIITFFMSQVYLAEHRGSTNWGDRKSNQLKCWFLVRRENRSTRGKTSPSSVENQQTQPTYDVRSGNRTWITLLEGQCSHRCANTAPLRWIQYVTVKYFIEEIMMKLKARMYDDNLRWFVNSLLFYLILVIGIFFSSRAYKEEKYSGIWFTLQSTSQPVKPLVKQSTRFSLGKPAA